MNSSFKNQMVFTQDMPFSKFNANFLAPAVTKWLCNADSNEFLLVSVSNEWHTMPNETYIRHQVYKYIKDNGLKCELLSVTMCTSDGFKGYTMLFQAALNPVYQASRCSICYRTVTKGTLTRVPQPKGASYFLCPHCYSQYQQAYQQTRKENCYD